MADVYVRSHGLRKFSDAELKHRREDLRDSLATERRADANEIDAFALTLEALRRTVGVDLYAVQMIAARAIVDGGVSEMATGEGKTLAVTVAAMLVALRGQAVHVVNPNAYLAKRDFDLVRPAFEMLDLSVGLVPEGPQDPDGKRVAYLSEVTYGTAYEFGFDHLRDQLALHHDSHTPLGGRILQQLARTTHQPESLVRPQHAMAIVDEVDNVLIDDAGSPLVLSDSPDAEARDSDACYLARQLVSQLKPHQHYEVASDGRVQLTCDAIALIYRSDVPIPVTQLRRPWDEYVRQAVQAEHCFHLDAHYVIEGAKIRIVDPSTGRIFSNRTWRDGLHQAIEAKERLPISSEATVLAQVTRQRFFRRYAHRGGTTGTAQGCESEFRAVYNMDVHRIPRQHACRREVLPTLGFATRDAKWEAIGLAVQQRHARGQPVLIGTRTILQSETLAERLRTRGLPFQLLNGRQDAEEAAIVAQAGKRGAITIATNLAGRGTDIRLGDDSASLGGLHVIVSEPHELTRIDRQLVGRCARQGDPGSAQTFVSAEDDLIQQTAPWLAQSLGRLADASREIGLDLTSRVRRVQRAAQRHQAAARMALLQQDRNRDSSLAPSR